MRLQDKVALITGAGSGIVRQTALLFAGEGAKIVVVDINDAGGQKTVQMVEEQGGQATYVRADVSKATDCENMVRAAEDTYGKLNVLFNNAGISHANDDDAITTDEAVWDLTMAINLKGVFLGCKYGIPPCDGLVAARLSTPPLLWLCWEQPRPKLPTLPAKAAYYR